MKKSEKQAKDALRNHPQIQATDHVIVVGKRGARMDYNQGQAVKQKTGSGLRDIAAFLKPKKRG